jgi:hypothetical protein
LSNFGQVALTIVGGIVGFFVGGGPVGALYGSQLGLLAGSMLFPTVLDGPQITDLNTTNSTDGAPVTIVWGTIGVPGNVIWLAPIVTSTSGGKSGPDIQTFNYTQSIAIGICEATTPDGTATPIGGMQRVWENGKLVYDISPQDVADGEDDQTYANRLAAAASYAETFVLYLGTEDQLADPTIESVQGAGAVPAFRGLCYIVYPNRALTDAQALRHPTFKFEVYTSGTLDCKPATSLSTEVLYPWVASGPNDGNINSYSIAFVDDDIAGPPNLSGSYTTLQQALDRVQQIYGFAVGNYLGYSMQRSGGGGIADDIQNSLGPSAVQYGDPDPPEIYLHFSSVNPTQFINSGAPNNPPPGPGQIGENYASSGALWWYISVTYFNTGIPIDIGNAEFPPFPPPYISATGFPSFQMVFTVGDAVIEVQRTPGPPADPCAGLQQSVPGFALVDGVLEECGGWAKVSGGYVVLATYLGAEAGSKTQYPLNPCVALSDPNAGIEGFWVAAYDAAVAAGTMPAGKVYNVDYPKVVDFAYLRTYQTCVADPGEVSLATIIAGICHRVTLENYDVSDLDAITVGGYAINSQMAARSAIDPLRSVGFFDVVESGETLVFRTRGKPIVATLTADDLGAFEGASDTPPAAVTVTQIQDVDLPRTVRLNYIAISRDYQPGQQISESRLTTLSVNDVDVNLAVAMQDTQALQIADVLWASAWTEALQVSFALDQSWSELEPGDCIALPVDGVTQRIRIITTTDSAVVLRKMQGVLDNDASYVSTRVAPPLQVPKQTVRIYAPTVITFLDIPALRDEDNDAGFYVAAALPAGTYWTGALLYQSLDGGASYSQVGTLTQAAVIGTVATPALGSASWDVWDDASALLVTIPAAQAFASATDAAVLAGANGLAVGVDGRWEIIQFGVATKQSDTQWLLTHLLRGRRGTEYLIGTGVAGDTVVQLTNGGILDVVLQTSQIGATLHYKCVSVGMAFDTAVDRTFVGHGKRLQCFSPVDISITKPVADVIISWVRRNRLGTELAGTGMDIAMSESVLSFELDILIEEGSPSVLTKVRTVTVTAAESYTYLAADQLTDVGFNETTFTAAVAQISSVVGNGPSASQTSNVPGQPPVVIGSAPNAIEGATFVPGPGNIGANDVYVLGVNDQVWIFAVRGSKGTAPCLGFYIWDLSTVTFIGSSFDNRWPSPLTSTIPEIHGPIVEVGSSEGASGIQTALVALGSDDQGSFFWGVINALDAAAYTAFVRWLYAVESPGSGLPTLALVPVTDPIIAGQFIIGISRWGNTTYALVAGNPAKVYTSADGGITWTLKGSCTGTLPALAFSNQMPIVRFKGAAFMWTGYGLQVNAAGDLVDWAVVSDGVIPCYNPVNTAYTSPAYVVDIALGAAQIGPTLLAANDHAIILTTQMRTTADGITRNLIFYSTDGATFSKVRDVPSATDFAAGFANALIWDVLVPWGVNFMLYGHWAYAQATPQALQASGNGSGWTMYPVDNGDASGNSIINQAAGDRENAQVVAVDHFGPVVNGVRTARLIQSIGGLSFTAITIP